MNKRDFSLLRKIVSGSWLMDEQAAYGYLPIVSQWMQGKIVIDKDENTAAEAPKMLPSSVSITQNGESSYYNNFDEAPEGSISITRVQGSLMKEDDWCWGDPGTASLAKAMKKADQHKNINSHILIIDSPGGTVDGTKDFADAVKATNKPIVAYVDGMAASAAYWIASAADEIILSNDTTEVGSIGTMLGFADFRGFYEKEGIKFHDIRATEAFEKNEEYYQALKGNYKLVIEQQLNPMNDIFIASVKENMPGVKEKALHGRMYLAKDAIENGLAHSIGTFEDAVMRVKELSKSANKSHSIKQTDHMFGKQKFSQLAKAAEQEEPLSEEQIQAINEELEAQGIENHTLVADVNLQASTDRITELETQLTAANLSANQASQAKADAEAQLSAANAAKTQAEADRDAWKTKAEAYGSQPGAVASEAQSKKDEQLDAYAEDWDAIDKLPHNQRIDQNHLINQKK